jgi:hypothetical protein
MADQTEIPLIRQNEAYIYVEGGKGVRKNGLAERVGFEPTLEFPLNTLSKRAPSTTRPSLLGSRSL